jgi:hypothetical protein
MIGWLKRLFARLFGRRQPDVQLPEGAYAHLHLPPIEGPCFEIRRDAPEGGLPLRGFLRTTASQPALDELRKRGLIQ